MVQNLLWATVYNLVAIPAAAGMFIRWGIELPMSVGAMAMNLSTVIVALNAQLLRRLKLEPCDIDTSSTAARVARDRLGKHGWNLRPGEAELSHRVRRKKGGKS